MAVAGELKGGLSADSAEGHVLLQEAAFVSMWSDAEVFMSVLPYYDSRSLANVNKNKVGNIQPNVCLSYSKDLFNQFSCFFQA